LEKLAPSATNTQVPTVHKSPNVPRILANQDTIAAL